MSHSNWSERIKRVTSYIEDHLEEIDSPRECAEVVDVSYEALRKQFRRAKGMPVGKYIRQARIDEARRRLLETDEPVYKICWKVGFSSDSNGIRAFKRCTGMTMGEYRRRYQGEGSS